MDKNGLLLKPLSVQRELCVKQFFLISKQRAWTLPCLEDAVVQSGGDVDYHLVLFPQGLVDAKCFLFNDIDRQVGQRYCATDGQSISGTIAKLLHSYVDIWAENRALLRSALAVDALSNARLMWQSVDMVWRMVGDKSLDYNYYSKRSLLWMIFHATILYCMNDTSLGCVNSKSFADRCLARVMRFARRKKRA